MIESSTPIHRDKLLSFHHGQSIGSYRIVSAKSAVDGERAEPLGKGGSGVVFRAEQKIYHVFVTRAIKFFVYRDDIARLSVHGKSGPISASHFLDELNNLASLRHENIVKVIDANFFDFANDIPRIPFLVTDFVDGPNLEAVMKDAEQFLDYFGSTPARVLDILLQLCRGLGHLHRKMFYHFDIAPKNIFLEGAASDCVAVIGDLGIARSITADTLNSSDAVLVVGTAEYCPPEVVNRMLKYVPLKEFSLFQPRWDLFALATIGLQLLNQLQISLNGTSTWGLALKNLLLDVVENKLPQDIVHLENRIRWLRPVHRTMAEVPELAETFDSKRNELLALDSAITSNRVRGLFHHPSVLRLKSVPQLLMGPAIFAGAAHNRYEHSIGVYETMRQYLRSMMESDGFLRHFDQSKVELALVAAALSNIELVPFAHVISMIRSHDSSLFEELDNSQIIDMQMEQRFSDHASLEDFLADVFPQVDQHLLRSILSTRGPISCDPAVTFVGSALYGSLGAITLDSVRRDSWHLGVSRGDPVDSNELMQHLLFRDGFIAIQGSGLSVVEQIITQRYWLYRRVYWNEPYRSLHSMLRHLFLSLHKVFGNGFSVGLRDVGLSADGQQVLRYCAKQAEDAKSRGLLELAELLLLSRPAVYRQVFQMNRAESPESLHSVCNMLERMRPIELLSMQTRLTEHLASELEISNDRVDLLIDMPTKRSKFGEDINVLTVSGVYKPLQDLSPVVKGVKDGFEKHIQRARVFLHPAHSRLDGDKTKQVGTIIQDFLLEEVDKWILTPKKNDPTIGSF